MPTPLSAPEFVACFVALCCSPFDCSQKTCRKTTLLCEPWSFMCITVLSSFTCHAETVWNMYCLHFFLVFARPRIWTLAVKGNMEGSCARKCYWSLQVLFCNASKTATRVANFCEFDVFRCDFSAIFVYVHILYKYNNPEFSLLICWCIHGHMVHFVFVVAAAWPTFSSANVSGFILQAKADSLILPRRVFSRAQESWGIIYYNCIMQRKRLRPYFLVSFGQILRRKETLLNDKAMHDIVSQDSNNIHLWLYLTTVSYCHSASNINSYHYWCSTVFHETL